MNWCLISVEADEAERCVRITHDPDPTRIPV